MTADPHAELLELTLLMGATAMEQANDLDVKAGTLSGRANNHHVSPAAVAASVAGLKLRAALLEYNAAMMALLMHIDEPWDPVPPEVAKQAMDLIAAEHSSKKYHPGADPGLGSSLLTRWQYMQRGAKRYTQWAKSQRALLGRLQALGLGQGLTLKVEDD